MEREYVLVINPGSTSTKVALYKDKENIISKKIIHKLEDLKKFEYAVDQYEYRLSLILDWLKDEGFSLSSLIAVVGRGGLLRSMPGGTYIVTDKMIDDLKIGIQNEHASNLGGILARGIADMEGIKAYIVDPVAVDEFDDIARISGMPEIKRRSLIHALNIKAVSYRAAEELEKDIKDLNFIVAHLGGGISIAPVKGSRMIDVNNASEMGPFSPERTGGLPVGDLVKMCYSGKYTLKEMEIKIKGKGGLVGYMGTTDAKEVEEKYNAGDEKAGLILNAMAYQISKEIGAMSTVLKGEVDRIILTGGLAYSKFIIDKIKKMARFIAPVIIYPGENEMEALNNGVLRVINGTEEEKIYEKEVVIDG